MLKITTIRRHNIILQRRFITTNYNVTAFKLKPFIQLVYINLLMH